MNHSELCHQWAHAPDDKSRRSGSMSFNGPTLYSYGTPIARIYRHAKRGAFVLVSDHNYSMTTAKHINLALRAVSHLPSLRVPRYIVGSSGTGRYRYDVSAADDHAANLQYLAQCAADDLTAAQRAMMRRNVEWRAESAARRLEQWKQYAAFFGIRRKAPEYPAGEWAAALARAERIENPDPVRDAARFRKREARKLAADDVSEYRDEMEKSMRAAGHKWLGYRVKVGNRWPAMIARMIEQKPAPWFVQAALRANWRLHGAFTGDSRLWDGNSVMLRLSKDGAEIETSQGARIPADHAPRIWRLVQAVIAAGRPYERNGHTEHAGSYAIDKVDVDGTLHAGCHVIPHSELRAMARALNLTGAA